MLPTDPKTRFGERLRRARLLRGYSLRGLSEALKGVVSHAALQKYEKGDMGPNSSVLNSLCEVLDLRPDFFFQIREVQLAGIEFRKRTKLTKKDEDQAREEAREFFERYLEVEEILGIEPSELEKVPVIGRSDAELGVAMEAAAEKLREEWGLGTNAIPNVHELLEDHGIKVKEIDAPECLDGFSGYANDKIPVIVIAKWLNKDRPRKRLTAVHELGHLRTILPGRVDHKQVESLCYRFGAAFLIPCEQFKEAFGGQRSRVSLGELIAIKQEWGISLSAAMRRARDLDLITERHYVAFAKLVRMRGWTKAGSEPGEWIGSETANRFTQLVCQAASKDLITRSKAAGLLEMPLRKLDEALMPL